MSRELGLRVFGFGTDCRALELSIVISPRPVNLLDYGRVQDTTRLPRGPEVVPFWGYLIGFYI